MWNNERIKITPGAGVKLAPYCLPVGGATIWTAHQLFHTNKSYATQSCTLCSLHMIVIDSSKMVVSTRMNKWMSKEHSTNFLSSVDMGLLSHMEQFLILTHTLLGLGYW